jgi:phage terminase large subunit-like protein
MQRWHEDDLAGRFLEDAERGGEQWHVVRLAMEAEEDDPLGRSPGEPLWPEWFTDEMRDIAKRDARTWLALYQQRPRPVSGGELRREWLKFYNNRPALGTVNTMVLVDPAGERKPGNRGRKDNTAIGVFGLGGDQNIYLLDAYRDRIGLTERTDLLFKLHREYRPYFIGYEKYGKDSDIAHIEDRMEREHYRFHITELGGGLRKEDRIRKLIPLFESSRIWLPRSLHRTGHDGRPVDIIERFIEDEYLPFPVGRYDDMLDMMARLENEEVIKKFPLGDIKPLRTTPGGSRRAAVT